MAGQTLKSLHAVGLAAMRKAEHASAIGAKVSETVDNINSASHVVSHVGGALGTIWTPGDLLSYMQRVNAQITSLQADILRKTEALLAASTDTPRRTPADFESFFHAWQEWRNAWVAFYNDHQSFLSRLTGTVADQIQQSERELIDWRTRAAAMNVTVSAPPPRPGQPPERTLMKVATVAGIILGVGATAWLIHEVRK